MPFFDDYVAKLSVSYSMSQSVNQFVLLPSCSRTVTHFSPSCNRTVKHFSFLYLEHSVNLVPQSEQTPNKEKGRKGAVERKIRLADQPVHIHWSTKQRLATLLATFTNDAAKIDE